MTGHIEKSKTLPWIILREGLFLCIGDQDHTWSDTARPDQNRVWAAFWHISSNQARFCMASFHAAGTLP